MEPINDVSEQKESLLSEMESQEINIEDNKVNVCSLTTLKRSFLYAAAIATLATASASFASAYFTNKPIELMVQSAMLSSVSAISSFISGKIGAVVSHITNLEDSAKIIIVSSILGSFVPSVILMATNVLSPTSKMAIFGTIVCSSAVGAAMGYSQCFTNQEIKHMPLKSKLISVIFPTSQSVIAGVAQGLLTSYFFRKKYYFD